MALRSLMALQKRNTLLRLVLAVAMLFAPGCRRPGSPPTDANTTDTAVTPDTRHDSATLDSTPPSDAKDPASVKDTTDGEDTDDQQATADPATSQQPQSAQAAAVPVQGTKHRVLIFPPDGPLLIELDIAVADRPLDGWIDSMLDEALTLADSDDDGRVTWDELYESDELEERFFADSDVLDQGIDATKRQYDTNRNDLVDRHELPRLLTAGQSTGRSFGLRSSNYYRELNRFASPLFRYLDTDSNGSLSAAEIDQSPARVGMRDFDNDEYVKLADLPLSDVNEAEMRNNAYQPHVAVWLGPRNPWSTVRLALTELYASGDVLSATDFPLTPKLFGELDLDQNGRLALRELSALTELPPHIAITARFAPRDRETPILSQVTLCDSLQQANVQVQHDPPWLRIQLPTSRIDLFARDMPIENPNEQASQLLAEADADENQYIDPDEYESADVQWESSFEELDTDNNEMIFLAELVPLFQSEPTLIGSQVRVRVSHRPDAMFSALDANGDRRLAIQEVAAISRTIARLDTDADGVLIADELPDYLLVGLVQGGDQQATQLFNQLPTVATPASSEGPDWFQAMDHNGDGQLSAREFLGKQPQFDHLDADHDGYLQLDEAATELQSQQSAD